MTAWRPPAIILVFAWSSALPAAAQSGTNMIVCRSYTLDNSPHAKAALDSLREAPQRATIAAAEQRQSLNEAYLRRLAGMDGPESVAFKSLARQALSIASEGHRQQQGNSWNDYAMGAAYGALQHYDSASNRLALAVNDCPALAGPVDGLRHEIWSMLMTEGSVHLRSADTTKAITAWETAGMVHGRRHIDSWINVGELQMARANWSAAALNYASALGIERREPRLTTDAGRKASLDLRRRLHTVILDAANRIVDDDPATALSVTDSVLADGSDHNWAHNLRTVALSALDRDAETQPAFRTLAAREPLSVFAEIVDDFATEIPVSIKAIMTTHPQTKQTTLHGFVYARSTPAGTPIHLEFAFYDFGIEVGTHAVTVNIPEVEGKFEITAPSATSFSYRVIPRREDAPPGPEGVRRLSLDAERATIARDAQLPQGGHGALYRNGAFQ